MLMFHFISPSSSVFLTIISQSKFSVIMFLFFFIVIAMLSTLFQNDFFTSPVASRALPVVGQQIWNDLSADVTSVESYTFRQRLKTHLFTKSFPGCFLDTK